MNYSTNGLDSLTKTPVILDTMVLLRMLADKSPYVNVLEKIKEKCNKIVFSTPILKECMGKAYKEGMSTSIMIRKLEELNQIKKLKKCNKTSIDKARKLINSKNYKKPADDYDLKFIEAALADKASIITKDQGLLNMNPYNCGKTNLEIITPEDYLENS